MGASGLWEDSLTRIPEWSCLRVDWTSFCGHLVLLGALLTNCRVNLTKAVAFICTWENLWQILKGIGALATFRKASGTVGFKVACAWEFQLRAMIHIKLQLRSSGKAIYSLGILWLHLEIIVTPHCYAMWDMYYYVFPFVYQSIYVSMYLSVYMWSSGLAAGSAWLPSISNF